MTAKVIVGQEGTEDKILTSPGQGRLLVKASQVCQETARDIGGEGGVVRYRMTLVLGCEVVVLGP